MEAGDRAIPLSTGVNNELFDYGKENPLLGGNFVFFFFCHIPFFPHLSFPSPISLLLLFHFGHGNKKMRKSRVKKERITRRMQ